MRWLHAMAAVAMILIPAAASHARVAADQVALQAYMTAQRELPRASLLPRTAFFEDRIITSVQLSPTGGDVAWLRKQGDSRSIWIRSTRGGKARVLLERTDAQTLSWSRDGRWLFLISERWLRTVSAEGRAGIQVPLGGPERRRMMQVDRSQPAAVLLRERAIDTAANRWRIVRVGAHGHRNVLREDAGWVHEVALDRHGRIVAMTRFDGQRNALLRVLANGRLHEVMRLHSLQKTVLLGALPSGALLLQGHGIGDRQGVLQLGTDDRLVVLHQDPRGQADVDEVMLDRLTGVPVAASYRSVAAATYGLGDARTTVAAIASRLPGADITLQTAAGRWLVGYRGSTQRDVRWSLFDPGTGNLRPMVEDPRTEQASAKTDAFVAKHPLSFLASDGRRIHGFLLIPRGVDAPNAPLVAQVHGGPINHFRSGFDGVAQLLANRGYVVYQSNFRGSTGYGLGYTLAANGGYADGRVQSDIVEGVRWLLAQGVGNPKRVGIVGHSFGGYSTLLGLTSQPELFKAGFAGAPPPDLGWSFRWELAQGHQAAMPDRSVKAMLQALSLDASDPMVFSRLHAVSPLRHAASLHRPMMIYAGGKDPTVPIRSIDHYVARLRLAGADVSLLVDPRGGHSPDEALAREAYLSAMETFLHRHLGGAQGETRSVKLQTWLNANLRAGPDIR